MRALFCVLYFLRILCTFYHRIGFLLKYVLLPVLFTLTQVVLLLITSAFTRVQIQSNLGATVRPIFECEGSFRIRVKL